MICLQADIFSHLYWSDARKSFWFPWYACRLMFQSLVLAGHLIPFHEFSVMYMQADIVSYLYWSDAQSHPDFVIGIADWLFNPIYWAIVHYVLLIVSPLGDPGWGGPFASPCVLCGAVLRMWPGKQGSRVRIAWAVLRMWPWKQESRLRIAQALQNKTNGLFGSL